MMLNEYHSKRVGAGSTHTRVLSYVSAGSQVTPPRVSHNSHLDIGAQVRALQSDFLSLISIPSLSTSEELAAVSHCEDLISVTRDLISVIAVSGHLKSSILQTWHICNWL